MKNGFVAGAVLLCVALSYAQLSTSPGPLNNGAIEAMLRQGTPPASIIHTIKTAPEVDFLVNSWEFSQLTNAGASNTVADQILEAMHQRIVNGPLRPAPIPPTAPATQAAASTPETAQPLPPPMNFTSPSTAPAASDSPIAETPGTPPDQTRPTGSSVRGAKVFISPMEGQLDGFIAAEIVKQKLPVTVVIDEQDADLVLVGASIKEDDKWYHIAFGVAKDRNEGNVKLLDIRTKTMLWAGEAGDRSLWYGNLRRGGQRKVADRIVHKMHKDLF